MNNEKIIIKLDERKSKFILYDITDKMQIIMGNFVTHAEVNLFTNYYSEYDKKYDMSSLEETNAINKYIAEIDNYFITNNSIDIGGININIIFNNGHKVTIGSSEWGDIAGIKDGDDFDL